MPKARGRSRPKCPICGNRVPFVMVTSVNRKRFAGCPSCLEKVEKKAGVEQGKLFDDKEKNK